MRIRNCSHALGVEILRTMEATRWTASERWSRIPFSINAVCCSSALKYNRCHSCQPLYYVRCPCFDTFIVSDAAQKAFERMEIEMVLDNPSLRRISFADKVDYLLRIAFPNGVEEYCQRWDRRLQVKLCCVHVVLWCCRSCVAVWYCIKMQNVACRPWKYGVSPDGHKWGVLLRRFVSLTGLAPRLATCRLRDKHCSSTGSCRFGSFLLSSPNPHEFSDQNTRNQAWSAVSSCGGGSHRQSIPQTVQGFFCTWRFEAVFSHVQPRICKTVSFLPARTCVRVELRLGS